MADRTGWEYAPHPDNITKTLELIQFTKEVDAIAKRTDEMAKGKHRKEWEKALEIAKVEVKLGV